MKIGDIEVLAVMDGVGTETAAEILTRPGTDDPWACHDHHREPDGTLNLPLGGFLVRSGQRTVLVDAGVGPFDDGRYRGGALLDSLAAQGVAPQDVTDVVFTHLHFDHVGWAAVDGRPVFPRATYRAHRADWQHFVTGPAATPAAVAKLTPLEGRLELFDADFTLAPGIDALHLPGHTPGTTVYVLSSGGRRALLLGDVVHSVVQFGERDWQVIWDVDPAAASAVRNRIADEAADTEDLLVAAHFPGMRFGRILAADGNRRFVAV
ncbi:glyoxylase-like metal-dependent hydrolase (beta-lactamase superfamily II) [Streptomyces sp. 1114.5]|uniref:MBL fold metallo-hydrolase n=1 Tax=unclassified Streptomyces TaxID=2593676 RepID=UPI000BCFABA4|nr:MULTISPECIES: MBL fold metallo-hydrolase [unclassified Streptomyces]RKT09720.1 glyoxylase-like metal-dependent hydrolase (beta-lactamase superfamily II) [Streptomyces sp. 1114.5]SOB88948.1 Glyoxylase, beta-lactamase superfamily II [Streptomyces sp. 1331.2]